MTVWVGDQGGTRRQLADPWVADAAGVKRAVQKIWVGDSTSVPRLVYLRGVPTVLTATAAAWNQINLSWTDSGTGATYALYRGGTLIYSGTGRSFNDTGLSASTGYSYSVTATVGGSTINTSTASASTPTRPTSTGSAYSGVGWESFTGWTASTQRTLGGPSIAVPVTCYATNMVALVYGKGGVAFRGEPRIDGAAGPQQVYTVGRTHTNWPFNNLGIGAGTKSTAVVVGGSNWGTAEWSPWSGQRWDYYCHVDRIDYWYYAGREADDELRRLPWWRDELEGRGDLHVETWCDEDGAFTRAKVTDKTTGVVLVDWEA